jgi:hypothetical protein
VTPKEREEAIRRRALRKLDEAIAEAKRLLEAARSREASDPLIKLRETLRARHAAMSQPHLAADDPDDPV